MKQFIKKLFGLDKIEQMTVEAEAKMMEAVEATAAHQRNAEKARQDAELAKLTPKERATAKGEAWVCVLDTHVNKDNIRNGFFELDWNAEFIVQLKQAGYGYDGDPDEEIVDRWFRDLARNMLAGDGMDTSRGAGYINVARINKEKSEVS